MVFLILMREFLITGLRIAALSRNDSINTSMLGKAKTTAQMITISVILLLLLLRAYVVQIGLQGIGIGFDEQFSVFYQYDSLRGQKRKRSQLVQNI